MQYQVFVVSAVTGQGTEELNRFLRSHRVVSIEKRFLDRESGQWCFCIEYLDGGQPKETEKRSRVDYREVLSSEDFAVYAKLREVRKTVAENDGVPVYAVFTNEQLAQMVEKRVRDKKSLAELSGVGSSKLRNADTMAFRRALFARPEARPRSTAASLSRR